MGRAGEKQLLIANFFKLIKLAPLKMEAQVLPMILHPFTMMTEDSTMFALPSSVCCTLAMCRKETNIARDVSGVRKLFMYAEAL